MTKEIQLNQDKVALVDDEDYEYLNQFKWFACKSVYSNIYYALTYKCNKQKQMHRLIINVPIGKIIDHINHNGLDNRKENLRICTHTENMQNSKLHKDSTSGYKGVSKRKSNWRVEIQHNKTYVYVGLFKTALEAAYAYDEAASILHGEFAYLNFPDLTSKDRNCSKETLDKIKGIKYTVMQLNNTSGYRGVCWDKRSRRWKCSIRSKGKHINLGEYKSKIECALVYDENAVKYHGDKAYLNFPMYI